MKIAIALLAALFCVTKAVPLPKESIELLKIPLNDDKEIDVLTLGQSDDESVLERNKRTIGILRELFPQLSKVRAVEDENLLEPNIAGSDAILETIRVARGTNNLNNNQNNQINTDHEAAASEKVKDVKGTAAENESSSIDELTLESIEDDENRGKRFLSFGGQSEGQANGSGGSGNFLFDIIRLVSGSSGTEQTDEKSNQPETDVGSGDGYTEGIPGPVTRLFVLANRGLSNLIQDLILRIAQTSERVVNFKARLITSLI